MRRSPRPMWHIRMITVVWNSTGRFSHSNPSSSHSSLENSIQLPIERHFQRGDHRERCDTYLWLKWYAIQVRMLSDPSSRHNSLERSCQGSISAAFQCGDQQARCYTHSYLRWNEIGVRGVPWRRDFDERVEDRGRSRLQLASLCELAPGATAAEWERDEARLVFIHYIHPSVSGSLGLGWCVPGDEAKASLHPQHSSIRLRFSWTRVVCAGCCASIEDLTQVWCHVMWPTIPWHSRKLKAKTSETPYNFDFFFLFLFPKIWF